MTDSVNMPSLVNPQQFVRTAEFKDVYSNFVRLGVSGSDINVVFGKIIEPAAGINVIEDQVMVRMSPHQFKTFLDQATKTFNAWEEVFGEVNASLKSLSQEVITNDVRRLKEALNSARP
jgi:hypothetical protein